jgi:hypothetical protein
MQVLEIVNRHEVKQEMEMIGSGIKGEALL